jgi:hypothetical protein
MAIVATTDKHATSVATDVDVAYAAIIWLIVDDIINSMCGEFVRLRAGAVLVRRSTTTK